MRGDLQPFQVTARKELEAAGQQSHYHPQRDKQPAVVDVFFCQQVVGTQPGHDERAGDDGPTHGMQVLRENPGVEENCPVVRDVQSTIRGHRVANGVLHPGV